MKPRKTQHHLIVSKFFDSLRKSGPLGTFSQACTYIQNRLDRTTGVRRLFSSIDEHLHIFQRFLDSSIDRKYGIDTSGVIPLKDLTVESDHSNVEAGVWYEPMSVKIFKQIMNRLTINFSEFQFIDFGSGKGRVLLMASAYGFNRIIGVEFAQELHRIATSNVFVYENYTKKPSKIDNVYEDATSFAIPNSPLVVFFYSPFKGKVMEHVLNNISTSFTVNPRKIILIFYGQNPKSIELLKAMNFQCKELQLRPDWSRFNQYRSFLFTSPEI